MAYTLNTLLSDFPNMSEAEWRKLLGKGQDENWQTIEEDVTVKAAVHQPNEVQPPLPLRPKASPGYQILQALPQASTLVYAQQALEQGAEGLWLLQDHAQTLAPARPPERLHVWRNELTPSVVDQPYAGCALPLKALLNGRKTWREWSEALPNCNTETLLWVPGHYFHAAGAYASEELAGLLAVHHWLYQQGEPQKVGWTLGAGGHFLLTLAKFRAARHLAVRLHEQERSGQSTYPLMNLAGVNTAYYRSSWDPENNLVRDTLGLSAAVLGGAETLIVKPYHWQPEVWDEQLRLGRNLPLMFQHEAHLNAVLDPLGGSYVLEDLTQQLMEKAWVRFQEMEAAGGAAVYSASGEWGRTVQHQHETRKAAYTAGKKHLVGVTQYQPQEMNKPVERHPEDGPFSPRSLALELEQAFWAQQQA